jgi:two-component system CheB/CheR fusion protein
MESEHAMHGAGSSPHVISDHPEDRTIAGYERALEKQGIRLREALAREEALLHQKDELIQQQEIFQKLFTTRGDTAHCITSLTTRERQILELVLAGHPSKNIASDLGINQRTVENHRASIMRKTGSKSVPALVRWTLAAPWKGAPDPSP